MESLKFPGHPVFNPPLVFLEPPWTLLRRPLHRALDHGLRSSTAGHHLNSAAFIVSIHITSIRWFWGQVRVLRLYLRLSSFSSFFGAVSSSLLSSSSAHHHRHYQQIHSCHHQQFISSPVHQFIFYSTVMVSLSH